jgi:flagellin-specific chaperone FliS
MSNNAELLSKLREYLAGLSPEARQLLLRSVEGARAKGEETPVNEIIMSALRDLLRNTEEEIERIPTPERAFFLPLDPFVIPEQLKDKEQARITRASLRPIWIWLTRDLAPENMDAELAELRSAAADQDRERLMAAAKVLRVKFAREAQSFIASIEERYGGLHRLSAQLGGQRAVEDLLDMLSIFDIQDELEVFKSSLPDFILANKKAFGALDNAIAKSGIKTNEKLIYVFAILLEKVDTAEGLVEYAVHLAKSDKSKLVRKSPGCKIIDLIFAEMTREAELMSYSLERERSAEKADIALKRYYELLNALESNIDIDSADPWNKRLTEIRTRISDRLMPEIEPAPTLTRRVLRTTTNKAGKEIAPDPASIEDAVMSVKLLMSAKHVKTALALNSLINDGMKNIEQMLDTLATRALNDLEDATSENKQQRLARTDAAIALAEVVFGGDYVNIMKRKRNSIIGTQSEPLKTSA